MNPDHHLEFKEFNSRYLQEHSEILKQIASLYCSIWEKDEAFGEYRFCQNCQKYFSYEQVEVAGIRQCTICGKALKPAWEPEQVSVEILRQASSTPFFGMIVSINNAVQGFTWLIPMEFDEISRTWGQSVCKRVYQLNPECNLVIYYDELGVAHSCRHKGVGRKLIYHACNWCITNYPKSIGLLRTHKRSRALPLFELVGFEVLSDDTEYGDERVLLSIPELAKLTPWKLL